MNSFDAVFLTIKEHCREEGVPSPICYFELAKMIRKSRDFLPLHVYMEVFTDLGLITVEKDTKEITLTHKGAKTERLFNF